MSVRTSSSLSENFISVCCSAISVPAAFVAEGHVFFLFILLSGQLQYDATREQMSIGVFISAMCFVSQMLRPKAGSGGK